MFNRLKLSFLVLLILMFVAAGFGQDYNNTTRVSVGPGYVLYYGNTGTMTDSTGDYYSRAVNIGIQDRTQPIYIKARTADITGTEDVNVNPYLVDGPLVDISNAHVSIVLVDQLTGSTMQTDTLTTDEDLRAYEYLYLHFDGQTGNPQTVTYWWVLVPLNDAVNYREISAGNLIVSTQP